MTKIVGTLFLIFLTLPTLLYSQISCPRTCQSDEIAVRRRCENLFLGCAVYSCGNGEFRCDIPYPTKLPAVAVSQTPSPSLSTSFQFSDPPIMTAPEPTVMTETPSMSNIVPSVSYMPLSSVTIVTFISATPSASPFLSDLPPPHIVTVPTIISTVVVSPSSSRTTSPSPSPSISITFPSLTPTPVSSQQMETPSFGYSIFPTISLSVPESANPTPTLVLGDTKNCTLSVSHRPGSTTARCSCELRRKQTFFSQNVSGQSRVSIRDGSVFSQPVWSSGHNTFGDTGCVYDCVSKRLQFKPCVPSRPLSDSNSPLPSFNRSQVVHIFENCCIIDCGAEWIWNRTCISTGPF